MSYREDLFRTWVDLERLEQQMRPATHFVLQQFDCTSQVAEKMRRVECVRKALHDSGTLARSMVTKALMGIEISTVWDILIGVCKDVALYYGGSVLTGGVLGGIGGAVFGWGLGTVPGAMAGASSGAAIGGWILGLLGLSALVEDLIATLPRALQYYQQGIQEAWRSSSENRSCSGPAAGNHGSLSQATFLLANGHVQMVITLLSALMLWISRGRGGRADALQSINQSARLGPRFAQWIETNEEKLHTLLASRHRQGGGGAGRVAESAGAKAAKGGKGGKNGKGGKDGKGGSDGGKIAKPPKRKPKRRCELVPYEELECGPGQEAHHVVPDWMLRMGKRKGPERIPGLPSLDRGPAICLERGSGKEHNVAHKHTDRPAERVARSGRSTGTAGTLKLGQGKRISARAIEKATGGRKDGGCDRKDIQKQLDEMIRAHNDTLLRGVKDARKVTGEISNVLRNGKNSGGL